MSRFTTSRAFFSMNSRRGSTASPIRMVKISSAPTASSMLTRRSVRVSGFMVVSQSCSGFRSDELATRLHGIAHQDGEDLVGSYRIFHADPEERARLRIHGGFPELLRVPI